MFISSSTNAIYRNINPLMAINKEPKNDNNTKFLCFSVSVGLILNSDWKESCKK